MVEGIIYQILNVKTNKIYVGSSLQRCGRRKTQHFTTLRKNKHHSSYLQNSFNKHGEENFVFEVIETLYFENTYCRNLAKELLESIETFYIQHLKASYNMTKIAKRGILVPPGLLKKKGKMSTEIKQKISLANKGNKKPEGFASQFKKPILQYDLEGNFIREWEGALDAATSLNIRRQSISECARLDGKRKISVSGFQWRLKNCDDFPRKIPATLGKRSSDGVPIIQFDLSGNTIKEYNSIIQASLETNIPQSTISMCLMYYNGGNSNNKTAKGYIWKYKNN